MARGENRTPRKTEEWWKPCAMKKYIMTFVKNCRDQIVQIICKFVCALCNPKCLSFFQNSSFFRLVGFLIYFHSSVFISEKHCLNIQQNQIAIFVNLSSFSQSQKSFLKNASAFPSIFVLFDWIYCVATKPLIAGENNTSTQLQSN